MTTCIWHQVHFGTTFEFETRKDEAIVVCPDCNRKQRGSEYRTNRETKLELNPCCEECGYSEYVETHHIKFVAHGGGNEIENLQTLCPNCHRLKHRVKKDEGE